MSITLDGLVLPEELRWVDEFEWDSVQASAKRTLGGKLIVQESSIPGEQGRPVTLNSEDAWIERSDLIILLGWVSVPSKQMTLILNDARTFTTRFRHWDKPVLPSPQVVETAFPTDTTLYKLFMKLVIL